MHWLSSTVNGNVDKWIFQYLPILTIRPSHIKCTTLLTPSYHLWLPSVMISLLPFPAYWCAHMKWFVVVVLTGREGELWAFQELASTEQRGLHLLPLAALRGRVCHPHGWQRHTHLLPDPCWGHTLWVTVPMYQVYHYTCFYKMYFWYQCWLKCAG